VNLRSSPEGGAAGSGASTVRARAIVGEHFAQTVQLSAAAISAFADSVGDSNPLHHDEAVATRSRFGGLIASGTHSASLLMALTASYFSRHAQPLGLEFKLHFHRAVHAGDTLELAWTVTRVQPKASLGGDLVWLDGQARNQRGEVALAATATLLVMDRRA
jgi:acyl dehydratase